MRFVAELLVDLCGGDWVPQVNFFSGSQAGGNERRICFGFRASDFVF